MEPTAAGCRQPLHFTCRQIEKVDDGPRDSQQIPQAGKDHLGDRPWCRRRDERPVDLVQQRETLGGPGERGSGSAFVAQRQPPEPGEPHRQDHGDGPGHDEQRAGPLQGDVLLTLDDDPPAERGQPAVGGQVHNAVHRVLELRHPRAAFEHLPHHGEVGVIAEVLHADPRAVEDELALAVDDEEVAARDLDRQEPFAQHVQALHGGNNADDLVVDIADRHDQRHRQSVPTIGLVDLGHIGLPVTAHAVVPVTKRVTSAEDLWRFGLGGPDDSRPIGEEDAVELGERLMELPQVDERFSPVLTFDTLAEPEPPRIGSQDVEIALLSCLDRGGDAPCDGVVLSEVFALLDIDRLDEKEAGERKDDENKNDHGCVD